MSDGWLRRKDKADPQGFSRRVGTGASEHACGSYGTLGSSGFGSSENLYIWLEVSEGQETSALVKNLSYKVTRYLEPLSNSPQPGNSTSFSLVAEGLMSGKV